MAGHFSEKMSARAPRAHSAASQCLLCKSQPNSAMRIGLPGAILSKRGYASRILKAKFSAPPSILGVVGTKALSATQSQYFSPGKEFLAVKLIDIGSQH